ncbi:unnamed protein product [Heterobilharzia americana]|nr:unnamed protein product [Heterobilharzia americana]
MKTIKYEMKKDGTCKQIEIIESHRINCLDDQIKRISECRIKQKEDNRLYRQLLVTQSNIQQCACTPPKPKIYLEACDCPEAHTTLVKQIQKCPSWCYNLTTENCDHRCQDIFIWRKLAYDLKNPGHCRAEILKKTTKPCCCKHSKQARNLCSKDGERMIKEIENNILKDGQCTRKVQRIEKPVHCKLGLLKEKLMNPRSDGTRLIQSIYGYRDKCQCKIRIEEKLCNQSCPKSVYKVECDPGSRELVHKQIDYVNVGCSCETRIYKRRTKVFCPKYSNLISSLCSPITKIETRMYKVHFQKGCECKENVTVKTRRCGCPKDHFSDKRCDTTNNKLVSIRTHYELLDSACLPQKSLVEEPINCDTYTMKELRQNNGRKFKKLTCDEATGRAQLITYVWVPKNCECTRVKRILREGLCKCPKTHTLMHCDSETNAWVRRIITYRLDKENLMCQKHETHRSQPTFCPPSAIQWRPCDIQRGSRQLILTYYRRSHCHCIKQKQILSKPCGCQSGNPQITRKCDPIQGILQTITHKYQWNDKSNECVKVDVVKTMPVVCRIQPHIVRGKCVNGKLKETVIHNIPDANNCTCRKQIRTYERDCRCSTEFIRIGNCSLTRAYWKEILLEQQWDDRQQKCMIKKSVKTKRYCRCPPKRVNTACDNGYVVRTEISFKLNKLRAICQQIVSQSRFKPVCKETDGLRKSKKYQSLFYRHLQTKCDRSTCTRGLETYANEYNPRTCKCGWKLVSKKRCTCCGCPKPSLSYTCENERFLIVDITYYTTKQHRCGHECMRRVRTVKHKMSCGNYPPPSQSYWSQCDRTTCQQSFISPVYKVKNCRCILTPKVIDKRTCCCLKGEEKETFCRNGQLDVYTHRTHLQNWQCVRSTKKETVPIVCSKAVKIKYGECRPQTCRRPVFLIKSVADPNNCKCRQHQIVKEERECCCLRRSHQRLLCVGNCKVVIQQKYKFDAVNERCVKENFIRRKCPKCPSPNVLEGTCDTTGTCLKPIRHINYVIKGCQCQSVEQIRHVRCCCPAPRQLGSKCLADKGIIQNKNIYYELEKDRCIKRVKIEEKQVICPQNIEKNLSGENQFCDPNSCLQIVTTFKWSRIGCKCIKQLLTVPQVCCCTNRIAQSKKNCLPNGTIRLTIQNWKFNNGQCIKVNTVKDLPPPLCKPQEVTSLGPCDKTSGMQPILVTRSVIEECECKLVYREKRDRICACEAPTIHVKPCDRITCLQQTTTIKWALEAKDNKCHRLHPEIKMRPCCCRREIAKDSIFKKCIPTSGKTEITNRTYHFNMKREICEFKDQKKYTDLSCPTEANVIKGACNLANGIALDSITSWEKITSQCKCVQRTKYQKRICSCKHLDKTMKNPICSELHGMLVRKKTAHTLENGICLPKVIWLKKVVVCSSHKNVDKKCDPVTCNQLTTISWFDRKECKCVKKVQFIQGKCCCPKPVEYRECHQNGSLLIIKKVTYNLDEEKGICINQTDQIRKDVVCSVHGPRFIKRICDRQTCHPITILLKTVLKNCQCQRMIRKIAHPDIQCCCSEPRFQEKCDENYGIISRVTYRYELFKRQCITRKFVDQNKVACPEEKVTRGQCDVITKLRPVQRRFHTIVGCKCQVKIESKMEPCTCPLPVLVKENCTAGRISSRVWRLSYSLKRNEGSNKVACEQEKEYLFKEPCHCRPPKISKRCVGDNIIYMKQAEHLINRNDRKFCAIRHFMKKVPVTCRVNAVRVKEEQCENDLKRVTFMHETLDKKTCECKSQVKIEYEKCGCEKDNRVTESCQNGVRVTNKEIVVFSQSLGRCVKSNVRSVHPVVCATKHQVIKSSGCAIERQDGIYQSEEIRWEQVLNCKCVVKRRQILRLCACPKPSIEKQCLDTVNLVVYKNTFMHIGGQCLPNQEVVTTETRCQEKAQIVERSTCEKQPMDKSDITRPVCLETLKISVPTIVNCKCKPKIIQIQRRCCTSEPKVKQICDSVRGRWVKVIEKYVLAPGSILFKRDDLVVYDQIQKVTSEQQDQTVVCPQSVSYENCDRKTGLLTKVKTHYKRIGCECKPVKEITRGRCGCPPKRQWISECKQDFRYRRTILFKQINGTCVRQEKIGKQRCDCPKPIDRVYCDGNGRWVKCTTQYVYNSKTHVCRLLKHCVRWHDECPRPTNRIASPCNLQTQFKHLIQHVQFVKNRTSCKCDAVVKISGWNIANVTN